AVTTISALSTISRRDYSRRPRNGGVAGWTPLSGVSLRPSGRTPPGSRINCQTSSDHLLSLVIQRLPNRAPESKHRPNLGLIRQTTPRLQNEDNLTQWRRHRFRQ